MNTVKGTELLLIMTWTENNDSGIPLRLFLAKVIINLPAAFEPYAELWIRPLMRLVAQGAKYGDPMNYFVQVYAHFDVETQRC